MIDVTSLAEAYFRSTKLGNEFCRIVIDAFEAGYVAHRHEEPIPDDREVTNA